MSIVQSLFNGIESITNGHAVITTDHALIHQGAAFTLANKLDILSAKVAAISLSIPGDVAASYTFDMTAALSDLTYTAKTAGSAGNGITVTHIQEIGNNRPLSVSVTENNQITVSLATSAVGVVTSTAAQVKAAVNANPEASLLVICEDEGAGTGLVNDMALANLAGGTDAIYVHFKPTQIVATGGPVYVSLLEDYSFALGSALTPVNRNRIRSAQASALACKGLADATAIAGAAAASLDMAVVLGTSAGASKLGGSTGSAEEWVLEPGKNYLLTFTNATSPGATVTVGYELFWYEEGGA